MSTPAPDCRSRFFDPHGITTDESCACRLDAEDPLAAYRQRFHLPRRSDGAPLIYFAGNSLGLQPKAVAGLVEQELQDWAELGVDGHFRGKTPWYSYHEIFREPGARLVGALPGEMVMMNSLTVNLHLMMVTFYGPTTTRHRILMEDAAFPSDTYAVKTQLAYHGYDPRSALFIAHPRTGEHALRTEDLEALIDGEGESIALILLGAVNFFTGQFFDVPRIAAAAKRQGCVIGLDLAHAAGNVPLHLHDWGIDFAVWCNYKYLNSGPGAVGGCYVHERHGKRLDLPRFAGWWGNDPATRFRMQLQEEFVPREGADGWQVSNPPILSLAPVKASLDIFDAVGMAALRAKSQRLTGYLQFLIDALPCRAGSARHGIEVITPRDACARGCQLSLLVHNRPKELLASLHAEGVVCDFREPNVIRVAPVPLYNTYHEVWSFAQLLARHDHQRA